jgi:RNA polymerase sigma-70 factor (ECF subfamily)
VVGSPDGHHGMARDVSLEGLVVRARDGDKQAFEQVVRLTSPACYSLAYRLVGDEDDARDVVQDAYLRSYRSLRRFRGDAAFSTWLHRITVNCAADLLERRRRTSHDVLDDMADSLVLVEQRLERDPEAAAGATDDRARLVQALRELPDELRLVVVLRDVYDLAHQEIAKELGISQGAAKVRLHRARRRLRERLFPFRLPAGRSETATAGTAGESVVSTPLSWVAASPEGTPAPDNPPGGAATPPDRPAPSGLSGASMP